MAELVGEIPAPIVGVAADPLRTAGDEAQVQLSPTTPVYRRGYYDFEEDEHDHHHDDHDHHDHHEKRSVLAKVKDKAKKWRHLLAKKRHGHHDHDHESNSPTSCDGNFYDVDDEDQEQDPEYHGAPMYESEMAPNAYKRKALRCQASTQSPRSVATHQPSKGNDEHEEPALICLDSFRESSTHRIMTDSPPSPNKHLLEANTRQESSIKGIGINMTDHTAPYTTDLLTANIMHEEHNHKINTNNADYPAFSELQLLMANAIHEDTIKGRGGHNANHNVLSDTPHTTTYAKHEEHTGEMGSEKTNHILMSSANCEDSIDGFVRKKVNYPAISGKHPLTVNTKHENPFKDPGSNSEDYQEFFDADVPESNMKLERGLEKENRVATADSQIQLLMANTGYEVGRSNTDHRVISDTHRFIDRAKHSDAIKEMSNSKAGDAAVANKELLRPNTGPVKESGSTNNKAPHHALSDTHLLMSKAKHADPVKESSTSKASQPALTIEDLLGHVTKDEEAMKEEKYEGQTNDTCRNKTTNHAASSNKNILGANAIYEDSTMENYNKNIEDLSILDKNITGFNMKHDDPMKKNYRDRVHSPTSSDIYLLMERVKYEELHGFGNNQMNNPTSPNMNILEGNPHHDSTKVSYNRKTEHLSFSDKNLMGLNTNQEDPAKKRHEDRVKSLTSDTRLPIERVEHEELHGYGNNQMNHPTSPNKNGLRANTQHEDPTTESYTSKTENLSFSDKNITGLSTKQEDLTNKRHEDRVKSPTSSDARLLMERLKHEEIHGYGNNQMRHPTSPNNNIMGANTYHEESSAERHNRNTNHLSSNENLMGINMTQEGLVKKRHEGRVKSPTSSETHLLMERVRQEDHGYGNNQINHPTSPNKNISGASTQHDDYTKEIYNDTEHLSFSNKNLMGLNKEQEDSMKKSHKDRVHSPTYSDRYPLLERVKPEERHEYGNNQMSHPTSPNKNISRANTQHDDNTNESYNNNTEHLSFSDKNLVGLNTKQEDLVKKSHRDKDMIHSSMSSNTHLLTERVKHEEVHGSGNNQMRHAISSNRNILGANPQHEDSTKESYNCDTEHLSFSDKHLMGLNTRKDDLARKSLKGIVNSPTSSDTHFMMASAKHEDFHGYDNSQIYHPTDLNKNTMGTNSYHEESSAESYNRNMKHLSLDKNLMGINTKQEDPRKKSHNDKTHFPTSSDTHLLMERVKQEELHGYGNNQMKHPTSPNKNILGANPQHEESTEERYDRNTEHLSSDKNITGLSMKQDDPELKSQKDSIKSPTSSDTHLLKERVKEEELHRYDNNQMKHPASPNKDVLRANTQCEDLTTENYTINTEHLSSDKNLMGLNPKREDTTRTSHKDTVNSPTSSDTQLLMERVKLEELHGYGNNRMNHSTSPNKNVLQANTQHEDPTSESYTNKTEHLSFMDMNLPCFNTKKEDPMMKVYKDKVNSPTSSDIHLSMPKVKNEKLNEHGNNQMNHPTSPSKNISGVNLKHEDTRTQSYNSKPEHLSFLDKNLTEFNTHQENPMKKSQKDRVDSLTSSDAHLLMEKVKHEELHGYANNKMNQPTSPNKNILRDSTKHEEPTTDRYTTKSDELSFSDKNHTGFNTKHEDPVKKVHSTPSSDTHLLMTNVTHVEHNGYGNNLMNHSTPPNKCPSGANTKCEEHRDERSGNKVNNPAFSRGEDLNIEDHNTTFENLLMAKAEREDPVQERIHNKVNHLGLSDTELLIAKAYPGEPIKQSVRDKGNRPTTNRDPLGANAKRESPTKKYIEQKANISASSYEDRLMADPKQNQPAFSDTQMAPKANQDDIINEGSTSNVNQSAISDTHRLMSRGKHEGTQKQNSCTDANNPAFFDSTANTKHAELIEEHGSSRRLTKTVSDILAPAYTIVSDTSHTIALRILCPTDGDEIGALQAHDPVKELTETVSGMLSPAYTMVTDTSRKIASKIQSPRAADEIDSELVPDSFKEIARDRTLKETVSGMLRPAYITVSDASQMIASKIRGSTTRDEIVAGMANEPIKKSNSHKTLTETVSDMLAPAYTKMSDASHKITSKFQGQARGNETGAKQVRDSGISASEIRDSTSRNEIGAKMAHNTVNKTLTDTRSKRVAPVDDVMSDVSHTEQVWEHGQTTGEEIEAEMVHEPRGKNNSHKTLMTETVSKTSAPTYAKESNVPHMVSLSNVPHMVSTGTKYQGDEGQTCEMQVWDKGLIAPEIRSPTTRDERTAKMALDPITENISSHKTMTEMVSEMFAPAYNTMSDASHKISKKIKGQEGEDETDSKQVWDKGMPTSDSHGQTNREQTETEIAHEPLGKNNSHKILTESVSKNTEVSDAQDMIVTKINSQEAESETGQTTREERTAKMALDPITKDSSSLKTMTETMSNMLAPAYTMMSDASHKIATKIRDQSRRDETGTKKIWDRQTQVSKIQSQRTSEEIEAKMTHDPIRKNNSQKTLTEMPASEYMIVSDAPYMNTTTIKGQGSVAEPGAMHTSMIQGPRTDIAAKMALDPITKNNHQKTMTETMSEMIAPTYTMMSDASHKIATKIKSQAGGVELGANQVWDKGVSVKEYLVHKLEPGEDDRALSEVITDVVSQAEQVGVMEKVRVAFSSMLRKKEYTEPKICVASQVVIEKHTEMSNTVSSLLVKEEFTGSILPVSTHPHAVEIQETKGKNLQAYAN